MPSNLSSGRAPQGPGVVLLEARAAREAICIVASYDRLGAVLALVGTIRRHWVTQPWIHVALLNNVNAERPGFETFEGISFVDARELGIPNFDWVALKYSAYELACAIKPFIVRHALAQGHQTVWYVDSDILFFADPAPMRRMLERHPLVVTPHLCRPFDDADAWRKPTIGDIAAAGILNAGLFALRAGDAADFLETWSNLVIGPSAFLWELGHNQEQHAFNWALAFVPQIGLCRDPRINIAYWNLHERPIRWAALDGGPDDQWTLHGEAIVCFHFSGFDGANDRLSRFDHRHHLGLNANLDALCRHYRAALSDAFSDRYERHPYDKSSIGDLPLADSLRKDLKMAERRAPPILAEWPQDATALARFLMRQPGFQSVLPRLLDDVYSARPDLIAQNGNARVFPYAFYVWMLEHMWREYPTFAWVQRSGCLAVKRSAGDVLAGAIAPLRRGGEDGALCLARLDRAVLIRRLEEIGGSGEAKSMAKRGSYFVPAFCPAVFLRFLHASDRRLSRQFRVERPAELAAFRDHVLATLDEAFAVPAELRPRIAALDLDRSLARVLAGLIPHPGLTALIREGGLSPAAIAAIAPLAGEELGYDATDLVLVDWWLCAAQGSSPEAPRRLRGLPKLRRSLEKRGYSLARLLPDGRAPRAPVIAAPVTLDGVAADDARALVGHVTDSVLVRDVDDRRLRNYLVWWCKGRGLDVAPGSRRMDALVNAIDALAMPAEHGGRDRCAAFMTRSRAVAATLTADDPAIGDVLAPWQRGVNVFGYFRSPIGLGSLSNGVATALQTAGFANRKITLPNMTMAADFALRDLFPPFDFAFPRNLFVTYPHISYDPGDVFPGCFTRGRENIGFFAWEQRDFPRRWLTRLAPYDRLFALSHFAAESIARASGRRVDWLPGVVEVDVDAARRFGRAHFAIPQDSFVIGYVFDATSSIERKNPVGTAKAIRRAFANDRRVHVILKATNGAHARYAAVLDEATAELRAGGIAYQVITRHLPRDELDGLLGCLDVYLSLHRSEGFGYTIAEAMNLHVPVVVTGYSGNMDFTTEANAHLVRYRECVIERPEGPFQAGTVWADPDLAHAAELLRAVYEDRPMAARKAVIAHHDARRLLSRESVARRLAMLLGDNAAVEPALSPIEE